MPTVISGIQAVNLNNTGAVVVLPSPRTILGVEHNSWNEYVPKLLRSLYLTTKQRHRSTRILRPLPSTLHHNFNVEVDITPVRYSRSFTSLVDVCSRLPHAHVNAS